MRKLFIDPIGGAAGDMLCSALLDLGMDARKWQQELKKLELSNYHINIQKCMMSQLFARALQIQHKFNMNSTFPNCLRALGDATNASPRVIQVGGWCEALV